MHSSSSNIQACSKSINQSYCKTNNKTNDSPPKQLVSNESVINSLLVPPRRRHFPLVWFLPPEALPLHLPLHLSQRQASTSCLWEQWCPKRRITTADELQRFLEIWNAFMQMYSTSDLTLKIRTKKSSWPSGCRAAHRPAGSSSGRPVFDALLFRFSYALCNKHVTQHHIQTQRSLKPDLWNKSENCICVLCLHQAFIAYNIVWYCENMQKKTAQFYSEAQTEQKYAIWCRCWYLCGQKVMKLADTHIKWYKYQSSLYISNNMS